MSYYLLSCGSIIIAFHALQIGLNCLELWYFSLWWLQVYLPPPYETTPSEKQSVWSYHAIYCKNTSEPLVDSETHSQKRMASQTPSASSFSSFSLSGRWYSVFFDWFSFFQNAIMDYWYFVLFGNVGCEICVLTFFFLFQIGCLIVLI